MADYIYTMEIRLTPDQQRGVTLVQDIARAAGMNIYLTGGAVRDIISGFPIRDLDFSVQGNPLKLQKDLEKAGVRIAGIDDDFKTLYLGLPGNVRAEISMARIEHYEKAGKPPVISPATLIEDLRRRDFTVNAMALSLNPGSRGLLMDPFNGAADIEAKVLRVLHNYAFVEDPSRLIRASRFAARFHWPLEERTQARFDSAKENNYIEYISHKAVGYEIEQLAYEDDPLHIVRVLEKEGWLKVLNPHWTSAKVDTAQLGQLLKTRQQMTELGYAPDPAPAVMYFLTARLADKDIADMRKQIPRKDLVEAWRDLEDHAKELAKRLIGKEAATPSRTWKLLSEARPEMILFLAVTARQQAVAQKIKNFFTKWRQVQQKIPLPEMTELHITPQLPEYPKIAQDVFMLLAGWQAAFADRDFEVPEAAGAAATSTAATSSAAQAGKGGQAAAAEAAAAAAAATAASASVAGKKKKGKGQPLQLSPPAKAKAEASKPANPPKAEKAKPQKRRRRSPVKPSEQEPQLRSDQGQKETLNLRFGTCCVPMQSLFM